MTVADHSTRLHEYDELLRRFAAAIRGAQLYQSNHPLIARNVESLLEVLKTLFETGPAVTIGLLHTDVVVADTPMPKAAATMGELVNRLRTHGIERITFDAGVVATELGAFARAVAGLPAKPDPQTPSPSAGWSFTHIRVGRISADKTRDGIASDLEAIRQLYNQSVVIAEQAWDAALNEGMPDPGAVRHTVDGLADAVTQNRTALIALTAMKNYDNYTFTHMVNVSILTMGQARALGVEGRLLREFGLSALMHDLGKVRTPKEILNKPDKLTDAEFAIMRRHTIDGAEILRRTPEMPILAPVVAFEHHLRNDGTGYPEKAARQSLNLGTQLCAIADVYDAMRSQRAYQGALPTDRILAVLKRNDGTQFDPHLVRRFTQLLGIYPASTLVRLSSGEMAVVVRVHAPDPFRPRVRLLRDRDGQAFEAPAFRNLWEPPAPDAPLEQIVTPLDPDEFGIDPLAYL